MVAVVLHTTRLTLRTIEINDLENFISLYTNPKVMQHYADCVPYKKSVVTNTFNQRLTRSLNSPYKWFSVLKKGVREEFIGACGSGVPDENGVVEMAFLFDDRYWGQGFGTEAVTELVRYLFWDSPDGQVKMVVATVKPENIASERIMQKIGMVFQKKEFRYAHERYFYSLTKDLFKIKPDL